MRLSSVHSVARVARALRVVRHDPVRVAPGRGVKLELLFADEGGSPIADREQVRAAASFVARTPATVWSRPAPGWSDVAPHALYLAFDLDVPDVETGSVLEVEVVVLRERRRWLGLGRATQEVLWSGEVWLDVA